MTKLDQLKEGLADALDTIGVQLQEWIYAAMQPIEDANYRRVREFTREHAARYGIVLQDDTDPSV